MQDNIEILEPHEYKEIEPPKSFPQSCIDKVGQWVGQKLGMCSEGPEGNWASRISDFMFVDCPCCLFWRGAATGALAVIVPITVLKILF